MDDPARQEVPSHLPPSNEGRTPAAWTLVVGVVAGALVLATGMVTRVVWVMALGGVLILLGLVLGRMLQAMGLGQTVSRDPSGPGEETADC